jgi:uncharacterized SAM-binding protein YcdF (DUF218 family)
MRRKDRGGIFFRLLFIFFLVGFLFLLFVIRHPLMRFAGQFWVLDEPAAQSDAVIVLGDDNYAGDRSFHAAELYREGVAPIVVASGRLLRRNAGMAEMMEHDLESFGVPRRSRRSDEAHSLPRMETRHHSYIELPRAPHTFHIWTRSPL